MINSGVWKEEVIMSCNGMAFVPANFMLQASQDQQNEDDDTHHNHNQNHHHQDQPPIFPPQDFNGVAAFLGGKRSMDHLSGMMEQPNGCGDTTENINNNVEDELSDDGSLASGDQKKKRLNMEQVKTLEKSFEMGNKLEPERKVQLARALGLQPRQIAIWFQNKRARWKTKQLEKDYDSLKRQFDAIKAQNEVLQSQNQKLQSQALMSGRGATGNAVATESFNLNKETIDQGSCSNMSDNDIENSSDQINMVKLDMSRSGAGGGGGTDSPGQIPTSMPLFPTSSSANTNSLRLISSSNLSATQVFFHHNQQQQQQHNVKDENFSNMFCGLEDQSGFWPWLEQQQNFN